MSETAALARGIIKQLATWATVLPTMLAMLPDDIAADLRALCTLAAAITPESTDAELEGVWIAFLKVKSHGDSIKGSADMKARVILFPPSERSRLT